MLLYRRRLHYARCSIGVHNHVDLFRMRCIGISEIERKAKPPLNLATRRIFDMNDKVWRRLIVLTSKNEWPRLSKNTPLASPLMPVTIVALCSETRIQFSNSSMTTNACSVNLPLKYGSQSPVVALQYVRHNVPFFIDESHWSNAMSFSKRLPSTHMLLWRE